MKRKSSFPLSVLVTITLFLSVAALAQVLTADQVPGAVKQGFMARFPAVKLAEWKIKSDKNYEVEFTLKGIETAAKFDPAGKWLETETAISRSAVPKTVQEAARKRFKGYTVVERQSVQRWNEEQLIYELHLENAKEIVKAQFAVDGSLLNQSAKPKPVTER